MDSKAQVDEQNKRAPRDAMPYNVCCWSLVAADNQLMEAEGGFRPVHDYSSKTARSGLEVDVKRSHLPRFGGGFMPYKDPEKQREAQRRYEEKNRKGKQRTIWWAYLYEDSAPENFLDLMRESGMEGLAMKHDRDVTAAGEVKEAHWHVVVRFTCCAGERSKRSSYFLRLQGSKCAVPR